MKIVFYCQYVWGMGHLFRSVELVRALADHEVVLVAGGQKVDVALPEHVTLVRLPGLYTDEQFSTLIPEDPEKTVEDIQHQRKKLLFSLFQANPPELFIIELYPFGRSLFGFELQPLLDSIRQGRFGKINVVCSLRDILVEKKDPKAYEDRVLKSLNTNFDLLLIHSDRKILPLSETFSRTDDIQIPAFYTGFVTPKANPTGGIQLRRELGLDSDKKLIVVSAGGGRSGYALLSCVLDAYHLLANSHQVRIEMFSGPFRDAHEHKTLVAKSGEGARIRHFTKRFLDYLSAADLSISLAGYNTCMNLLITRVPALVFPYSKQREQPIRVEKIKNFTPMKILQDKDIEPALLSGHIEQMLLESRPGGAVAVDLDGAEQTARYLKKWIGAKK
jgi:predicted glycosyltransferase